MVLVPVVKYTRCVVVLPQILNDQLQVPFPPPDEVRHQILMQDKKINHQLYWQTTVIPIILTQLHKTNKQRQNTD